MSTGSSNEENDEVDAKEKTGIRVTSRALRSGTKARMLPSFPSNRSITEEDLAAEMEKLRLVRDRRAAQAKARIEADGGVDRYAVGAGGGAKKDADDSDDDSDDDSENDSD